MSPTQNGDVRSLFFLNLSPYTIIMPFRPSPVLFLNYPPLDSVTETLGAFAPNYATLIDSSEIEP